MGNLLTNRVIFPGYRGIFPIQWENSPMYWGTTPIFRGTLPITSKVFTNTKRSRRDLYVLVERSLGSGKISLHTGKITLIGGKMWVKQCKMPHFGAFYTYFRTILGDLALF